MTPRPTGGGQDDVPAYRIASFRVALGSITLLFHVPQTDALIRHYSAVSFHQPMVAALPAMAPWVASPLIVARHLAALALVLGVFPRASAVGLALSGAYVVALDRLYYAQHIEFHLILLLLLGVARHRVSLRQLLANDEGARAPRWPEGILRLQLSVVFFYAGLGKLLSPVWGTGGVKLLEMVSGSGIGSSPLLKSHEAPLAWAQGLNTALVQQWPGALSIAVTGLELVMAVALLAWRRSSLGVAAVFAFAVYVEFFVQPVYFMWDVLATLLLFAPVGDRAYTVFYDDTCRWCRRFRAIVSRGDWLRRLTWRPLRDLASAPPPGALTTCRCEAMILQSPTASYAGFDAVRRMLPLLAAPFLVAAILVRDHGGRVLGVLDPTDVPLIVLGSAAVLWLPGFSRFVGQPLYRTFARRRHGHAAPSAPRTSGATVPVP